MQKVDELLHEHQVLRGLAHELLDRTSRAEPHDPVALARCRARLLIAVSEHILFEDAVVKEADARGKPIVPNASRTERELESWMADFAGRGRR